MPDYTTYQFDKSQFTEAQNQALGVLSAICGPEVALAFARFYGKNLRPDDVVNTARNYGLWSVNTGMHGPQAQMQLLKTLGIPADYSPEVNFSAIQERVAQGGVAAVSTPNHYFFIQGYDPKTGRYDTGQSGRAYASGGQYLTAEQIRQLGGGLSGSFLSNQPGGGSDSYGPVLNSTFQMPEWAASSPYAQRIVDAAVQNGLDPNIFLRQLNQESRLNPQARNPSGAAGIAQLMPLWWQGKFDPYNPDVAIPFAANLMKGYLQQYGGDYPKALAAYNAGPGAVQQYGGIPPFAETQRYVKEIMSDIQNPAFTANPVAAENPASVPFNPAGRMYNSPFPLPGQANYTNMFSRMPMVSRQAPTMGMSPGMGGMPMVEMGSQSYNPYIGMFRSQFGQGSMQPPIVSQTNRLMF